MQFAALIATDEFLQWQLRPANVFVIQQVVETVFALDVVVDFSSVRESEKGGAPKQPNIWNWKLNLLPSGLFACSCRSRKATTMWNKWLNPTVPCMCLIKHLQSPSYALLNPWTTILKVSMALCLQEESSFHGRNIDHKSKQIVMNTSPGNQL